MSCGVKSQMWLGFHVAGAVAGSYSSDLTPSLGNSICCKYGPIKTKKKKNLYYCSVMRESFNLFSATGRPGGSSLGVSEHQQGVLDTQLLTTEQPPGWEGGPGLAASMWILALWLPSCVALGKSLHLSGMQFCPCKIWAKRHPPH